jgi:uncharacterized protein (DUF1697 family)
MPVRYVAFLRGINLGNRRVKNDDLSRIFRSMGFQDVKVLIQSGNVLFDADEMEDRRLTRTIEAGLEQALGYKVYTMLRSLDDVRAMIDGDPFNGIAVAKETRLYVTLLAEKSNSSLSLPHDSLGGELRILSRTDREVFSVLTLGKTGRTVDAMTVIEKEYGRTATTRSWNTIRKIAAL